VKSWDETDYVCKAGDTYRSISAHFYLNEAYAEALQLYNRNHPRASDAMRRDGTLVPGETLYIPPSGILEERHSAVIPKPAPAATRPVPASYRSPDPQPPAKYVQGDRTHTSPKRQRGTGDPRASASGS
jgi:hypothetical protein